MRAFIAVACPPEVKAQLAQAAGRIKSFGDLKVVEKENMHLTLRFLGEIGAEKVESVVCALGGIKKDGGFVVCIKGLGVFPGPVSARVVWAGVEKGGRELRELHKAVDGALLPLGFAGDERFSSHYTLARIKHLRDRDGLRGVLGEYRERIFGCFQVDSFYLMKSVLCRAGPVYSVVKEFRL